MIRVSSVQEYFARPSAQTLKMLLAGPPGSGKTLFCSSFPDVLYVDMEGRLLSVRHRPVHATERITTIAELEELRVILASDPAVRRKTLGIEVQTVVLDTVDEMARIVQKERLKNEKREALAMADWGWYGDQMRNILRAYRNLTDLNVVFTVHLRSTEDSETGRVEYTPSIQGQVGQEVAGYVDEAFLLRARPTVDENGERVLKRFLQCYPDSQYNWIKDHSGTLPPEFPVNFEDDYQRISDLIFADLPATKGPLPDIKVTTPAEAEAEPEETVAEARTNGKAVPTEPPLRVTTKAATVAPVVDVPLPEAEQVTPEPEPEPVSAKVPVRKERTKSAPAPAAASGTERQCAECGEAIVNADIAELSDILYGVELCHPHFNARQRKK